MSTWHKAATSPFPKWEIKDSPKLKEFADNLKLDENGKFSKQVENTAEKGETSNFSFSHSVFKWLVLQTGKIQGLFKKGLME